jgi:hypothetical protein
VKYEAPGRRARTPKHIHLIVDLYLKWCRDPEATMRFRNHLLAVHDRIVPAVEYPPRLQVFRPEDIEEFVNLNRFGEYDVEFFLVVAELIMIQERTNYPAGTVNRKMYEAFGEKDIYSVVSAATYRGGGSR